MLLLDRFEMLPGIVLRVGLGTLIGAEPVLESQLRLVGHSQQLVVLPHFGRHRLPSFRFALFRTHWI